MNDTGPPMSDTKCAQIAVIGAPNAGKSTLINRLVGEKVTIVSPKVQTTRHVVRGIAMHQDVQLILLDTPGLFDPGKKKLERAMVGAAWDAQKHVDLVLLLHDARRAPAKTGTAKIVKRLKEKSGHAQIAVVLNKVDQVARPDLLPQASWFQEELAPSALFMVSALKDDGVRDILDWMSAEAPQGPYLFPEDQVSDMPQRLLAAEITREKLFHRLHKELPYGLSVETEDWEECDDGSLIVSQIIRVARESHKPIVLGKGGSQIKAVGIDARTEMSDIFGRNVHVKLFVKIDPNWQKDSRHYEALGLDPTA